MKTIIKLNYLLIIIFLLLHINVCAQKEKKEMNYFARNSITKAVKTFHSQKTVGYKKYMVLRMKLIEINQESGEFVLSYSWMTSVDSYKYINPTHYVRVNNEIVLITVDNSCNCNPEKYGINQISNEIKDEVLDLDIIKGPKHLAITGQPSLEMTFSYKRNKMNSECIIWGLTPIPGREYWRNWTFSLSPTQKTFKSGIVNRLNKNSNLKSIEKGVKDSLLIHLKKENNLSSEIRNQDLDKLNFKYVFYAKLQSRTKVFNDTCSIYPYIVMRDDIRLPYHVLIYKNNHFWGRLQLGRGISKLELVSDIDVSYKKKLIDTYERVLHKKSNLLFYIESWGTSRIWYTKSDKIMVLQPYGNYNLIEADDYVHRFYTKEDIIRKMAE